MKRCPLLSFSLPLLILSIVFFLPLSCQTLPSAPRDAAPEVPVEVPAEEKNEAFADAEETEAPPYETPEFVIRAEEAIEPVDKNPSVSLPEPLYDLREPELADALEDAPPDLPEDAAPIALDEAVEKPPENPVPIEPIDPIAPESIEPETAVAEADGAETDETETEETALSETQADETEEPAPPPPPLAALRPSETPSSSSPPVPGNPPLPLRAQPALPARNPLTETEKYVKPPASREFHVQTGKTFEVPFDGTGWVYTGEESSKSGVSYDSRRIYGESQVFVFRAEKEGDYTLAFYKQDFLRDYVTKEYARVLVTDEPPPVETAALPEAAPDETDPSEPAPVQPATTESVRNQDLLQEAREAVAAQKYPDAINLLDKFQQQIPAMNDEAWWLYGQSFEAASPARDILSALDAYSSIIRDYPQSRYYKNAQTRIAFLNKFYLNIR